MNILGLFAALGAAISHTGLDLATKFAVGKFNPRTVLVAQWGIAGVILLLISAIWYPSLIPHPVETFANLTRPNFWQVLLADAVLNVFASYLSIRAFKYSDASIVAPLALLTPVLLLVTSPIMLHQTASPLGALGVVFIVVGGYILGTSVGGSLGGFFGPLKSLFNNRGARNMLYAAIIWSITSNLDKMGVASTTPLLWSASITTAIALLSIPFLLTAREPSVIPRAEWWKLFAPGAATALSVIAYVFALTLLPVPYVIAIKRTSVVFTVWASKLLFKENIKGRLLGSAIMVLGVAVIAFAG
ncbi:MAG: EamA family transporter [Patescibacteria group bacterium]